MNDTPTTRDSHLDGLQGADEQRTETYDDNTSKEQSQSATQQSVKSTSGVASSAGQQTSATHAMRDIDVINTELAMSGEMATETWPKIKSAAGSKKKELKEYFGETVNALNKTLALRITLK